MAAVKCEKQPVIKPGQGLLDNVVSDATQVTLPLWEALGATPNMLTTLGLVSTIMCIYLYYENNLWCLFFLMLRTYFDWADGQLARKRGPITKFGDYLDHFSDGLCLLGIVIVSMYRYKTTKPEILVFILVWVNSWGYMGCLEKECGACCEADGFINRYFGPLCNDISRRLGYFVDIAAITVVTGVIMYRHMQRERSSTTAF